jgi:hypothetical protein
MNILSFRQQIVKETRSYLKQLNKDISGSRPPVVRKKKKYDNQFTTGIHWGTWALPLMVDVDIVRENLSEGRRGRHWAMLWIISISLFCFDVSWTRFEVLSHEPKKKR